MVTKGGQIWRILYSATIRFNMLLASPRGFPQYHQEGGVTKQHAQQTQHQQAAQHTAGSQEPATSWMLLQITNRAAFEIILWTTSHTPIR